MLKIKDNVDLKDLEKFGFELENGVYVKKSVIGNELVYEMFFTNAHRNIQIIIFARCLINKSIQETLFDLIQAGLVEKVSDEK